MVSGAWPWTDPSNTWQGACCTGRTGCHFRWRYGVLLRRFGGRLKWFSKKSWFYNVQDGMSSILHSKTWFKYPLWPIPRFSKFLRILKWCYFSLWIAGKKKKTDHAHKQKYFTVSKAPLLINSCEVDRQFPLEASAKADEIFGDGNFAPGYKREYFAGCTHGFAVKGDLSKPKVKAGKEGAFKATVEWFKEYL